MTCSQCHHHFCWICLGDWSEHGSATGGYYKCNLYEAKVSKNTGFADEESKRQQAQGRLDRYLHFFTRYNEHDRSIRLAEALLPKLKT